uniref:FLZ-type domain-containing protein n=1 Tax=Solanum lycopersicum TaxID=4081 RepID=A0A3Q7HSA9_SOLLC|nr:myb-like protein D [Solanum lycopersicum]
MNSPSTATRRRRPCFVEEDDGLVSIAETQPEFSGNNNQNHINNNNNNNNKNHNLIYRPLYYSRRNSMKNHSSSSSSSSYSLLSPRSVISAGKYCDGRFDEPHHYFLDACSLCKKRLGDNSDIFMYRGDTPFCSEECRQQEIEKDEAKDRKRNISSLKAMRKKEQKQQSTSPNKTSAEDYPLRPGTVAAA